MRLGVDVGGTFTKAVAVEAASGAVVAQAVVPTTHTAAEGVTRGVVEALSALMERLPSAAQVVLVGHSTSQAVNALLEGDVAPVGIVGIGAGAERAAARRLTRIGDIALAPDRWLRTVHTFVDVSEGLSAAVVDAALGGLVDRGARVIVASAAYGVEDPEAEQFVVERARRAGLPACAGHELSGLYGLEVRTLTAAINASILPRMVETARYVEEGLRRTGVNAPLLVMRGDGGAMDLNAFRERPILTILSGPAASLAGALLHLRVADGVFLEVGGTSTNVAAIRGGRPALKYVRVMDHPTCLRSLDVRVLGVGGGSMARLRG
ncbi:MAG: glutamate mutase L, partial [Clostridia bacterium]|nr:glutamate mutase L [Clostridia bacterium]